jgi:hypothetical protein
VAHFVTAEDAQWLADHFAYLTPDGWVVPEWCGLLCDTVLPKGLRTMSSVKPIQETLPDGRKSLWFKPYSAYIVRSKADPEYFTLEYTGFEVAGLSKRSDDVMFLEKVEAEMRNRGHAMYWPTEADHVWLDPSQFELAKVPDDWKLFADESSGATIKRERYYGFGDAGGLAGSFDGYDTREAALEDIAKEHDGEFGTKPEHLGEYSVTVLSGEEYIGRLQTLDAEGAHFYGKFVG